MPGLTLLERLRRVRPPPGAAAGALAVPAPGDELAGEVAFLFSDLDGIASRREALLALARSQAAEAEQGAAEERSRLLADAHEEAQRRAAMLIVEHRARAQEKMPAILAQADRDAARIRARGRERTPALVHEIVTRLLEDAP
jgi:vacuolar-type H+-ATPase subunit H